MKYTMFPKTLQHRNDYPKSTLVENNTAGGSSVLLKNGARKRNDCDGPSAVFNRFWKSAFRPFVIVEFRRKGY